ncbi:MAG TPA: hypothetical protein VH256_05560 [Thermoleophilaceae bacterium]|nr:hypothetical protein [Thermoleophilaceae bacterium]
MKTGRVRASALLAGVGIACAIPAVATGQVDPNKVGNTVTGVTKELPQVPQQVQQQLPSLPSTPVTKSPADGGSQSHSTPRASTPSSGGGSGSAAPSSGGGSSGSSGSASGGRAHHAGAAGGSSAVTAHAASSKHAKAASSAVSGQRQSANPADTQTKVANVSSAARPDTGTGGDSRLPFTGYALLVVAALGVMALITGAGMRGLTRLRVARRRA